MAIRWLYGSTKPIVGPYTSSQVFTVGDLVARDGTSGLMYRAEDQSWNSTEAATRDDFVAVFVGIAGQSKRTGDTRPYGNSANVVRVDTDGVYEGDVDSATTFLVGDWIGPAKQSGNALYSQTVKKVTAGDQAIGVCVEAGTSLTKVKFQLISKIIPGGPTNTLESGT